MGLGKKHSKQLKSKLSSNCVLVHYYPEYESIVACDVSPYGVRAVLLRKFPDGIEKPIAFASRTLAQDYGQIE